MIKDKNYHVCLPIEPLVLYPPYEGAKRRATPSNSVSKRLELSMPSLDEMHAISLARARQTATENDFVGEGCREERLGLPGSPAGDARLAESLEALMLGMRADYMQLLQRMCSREYSAVLQASLCSTGSVLRLKAHNL